MILSKLRTAVFTLLLDTFSRHSSNPEVGHGRISSQFIASRSPFSAASGFLAKSHTGQSTQGDGMMRWPQTVNPIFSYMETCAR